MIHAKGLPPFDDYELLDSGHFSKLERFGSQILSRPEPQAIWSPAMPAQEWEAMAQGVFTRRAGKGAGEDDGNWTLKPGALEQWYIDYRYAGMQIRLRLGLTSFKHVGVFPEQADNWNFIYDSVAKLPGNPPSILNLFAYTGAASLAAKAAGADVVHVDSVKPVISWARQNMEASGLNDIRWVVEDALKFVKKEAKRGRTYQGIILDPPAYGRGPEGEKWLLDRDLNELLGYCSSLLDPAGHFLILNLYSMGFSSLIAQNLVRQHFPWADAESGELFVADQRGFHLPLGIYSRFLHRK